MRFSRFFTRKGAVGGTARWVTGAFQNATIFNSFMTSKLLTKLFYILPDLNRFTVNFNAIFIAVFLSTPLLAGPPPYGDGTATQDKIAYCSMLVDYHGHKSQNINSDYYGEGVQKPIFGKWAMRVMTPGGWFSKSVLWLVFEQTTKDEFKHMVSCAWSEDAPWFEFLLFITTMGAYLFATYTGNKTGMDAPSIYISTRQRILVLKFCCSHEFDLY
jgi:hypothetical protein